MSDRTFNDRETAAILAGLRCYQRLRADVDLAHMKADAEELATDGGMFGALTDDEIDELCEDINCGTEEEGSHKVVIIVEGGCVQAVHASSKSISARLFDIDTLKDIEGMSRDTIDALEKEAVAGLEAIL